MKTAIKKSAVLLTIGTVSVLFLSLCNGEETNAPTVTNTNQSAAWDNFQSLKFRTQGSFSLTNSVGGIGLLPTVQNVTKVLPDGTGYVGESMNGKPDGQGTLTSPNGTNLHGEWRDGLEYRIKGTWVGPDGTKEVGTWNQDGTKSGGTIAWKDGRRYSGEWKLVTGASELPDGVGRMTWPDGRKYEGHFRDGKMEGTGKMIYRGDRVEDGLWKDDKFVGAPQETLGSGTKQN